MGRIVTERSAGLAPGSSSSSPVCYADESDRRYAGDFDAAEIASLLQPLESVLPPERLPLVEYIYWRLGVQPAPRSNGAPPGDIEGYLGKLIPRVADDGIHAALLALRATLLP
jgi:hypothetical protein